MKTFIYSISFNVPLKSRGEVEKLLQKFPAFTYDVEEEQSVENFTNLLEKLKNL